MESFGLTKKLSIISENEIETEPRLILTTKHIITAIHRSKKLKLYEVLMVNYFKGLKKKGVYSGNRSGWQIFMRSLRTKSGLAVPNS